jgi:hypothetical protein
MTIASRLLNKLVARLGTPEVINGNGRCPTYLYRWELVVMQVLGRKTAVYLHKFVGPDWSTDLHDHPKKFWSFGLSGWYDEHTETGVRRFVAPWFRWFPATHKHRLSGPTPERPCWTLIVVGHPERAWGFWAGGKWIDWETYVGPNSAEADAAVSCQ